MKLLPEEVYTQHRDLCAKAEKALTLEALQGAQREHYNEIYIPWKLGRNSFPAKQQMLQNERVEELETMLQQVEEFLRPYLKK